MSRWNEMPLRPQGQPWGGLNTRGGRLDPGQGFLEDGSFNAVINEADILEKRKGLIRGLDERFDGPVCGLFRYTSDCGVEYLVVADSAGIFVRTPFEIPTFLGSDSLPNDGFTEGLDTTRWQNAGDYTTFLGSLVLTDVAATADDVAESRLMQWFKESALTSYFTEIAYNLVAAGSRQQAAIAIKRTGSTYLLARVTIDGSSYVAELLIVQAGVSTSLASEALGGAALAEGFLRLQFNALTRAATMRVIPSGGAQVTVSATLSELQANNLGQNTAIGIAVAGDDDPEIESVTAGGL